MESEKSWIESNAKLQVINIAEIKLASILQVGVGGLSDAFNRLMKWAGPKGLISDPNVKVITIYHDSFKVTPPEKVRIRASIKTKVLIAPEGELAPYTIPSGRHIVASLVITPDLFGPVWEALFEWMKEQGHKMSEQFPFELYHNNFNNHPEKKCIVDFCIPIL
ncbi:MAG: AraC family transcriptional regulator [Marinoscillum sp.]|jgi:AraC family transcriptional regulator